MDENIFRIVVTVAVVVASLAFLLQAGIMFALYKVTRKTREDAGRFMVKLEPVIAKAEPLIEKAGATIERVQPVIDRIGPALDQALPVIRKAGPVLDEAKVVVARAGRFMERATEVAATTNLVIADARPQIKQISLEAADIARLGREQVERAGALLTDAGDRTRARIEQFDQTVDRTIDQVGQAGDAVKRAAMKPVREVNALAAGFSAALGTLMRHRKSSVDSATQDEEMFI